MKSKNQTKYDKRLKNVEQLTPTDPLVRHHAYNEWAEANGYLKRNLDQACIEIATLVIANKALKEELKDLKLIPGQGNTLRDKVRG